MSCYGLQRLLADIRELFYLLWWDKVVARSCTSQSLLNPIYPGLQSCLYGIGVQLHLDSNPDYMGFIVLSNGVVYTACRVRKRSWQPCLMYPDCGYNTGVSRCANQPTKRFHGVRLRYTSRVITVLCRLSSLKMRVSWSVMGKSKRKAFIS